MSMYKSRLQQNYEQKGRKLLLEKFNFQNPMEIPRLLKVVVSMGVKEAVQDAKAIDQAMSDLFLITGRKAVVRRAKKSIASFKLRQGMPIGCKVTLRRHMMYEFVDRLINIALPRAKDFRGLSPDQFDGQGNYSLGLKEQIIFPEINYDRIDKIRGMNITIVTTAKNSIESKALLETFNFPFTK